MKQLFSKLVLSAAVSFSIAGSAFAADYNFKFQSSDPSGNSNFILQQGWTERLKEMSDGKIEVELMPVNSIVAHTETQDAIAGGILDGHITDTSYFSGRDPAFGLIANPVGAWSAPQEMFDFMAKGGGKELMNELVEPYGLHFIGATTPGLEAFISKKPLNSVADLKGLKMRAPEGLVQQVFAAAGASPVNLPGSEVFTSLDKGVIDAADYSVFSTNDAQGMHDVALFPVYPGFHSMPLVEISMNKSKWDALPADLRAIMEKSVTEFAQSQVAALAEKDMAAVEKAKADGKVTVTDWSPEERAKFRTIATSQWVKVAERSTNAKKVYDVLTNYLKTNGLMN